MARVEPSQLIPLQQDVEHIRNFCILAHVDHGKTTLSDSLVSSNGFISQRLAGKLRFLDSTEEEQKRGITMHSSAIALLYQLTDPAAGTEDYLINLVDSPGHIDFSSDVSTAARLCDGALIVVDVLEGVCTQTHAVIYKALKERMKPCLVLNKIDRLIVESRLSSTEAYHHLRRLIENVNALAFTLVKSELLKECAVDDANSSFVLDDTHPLLADWLFAADKGNVQFASALDGWGFGLMKFINLHSKAMGLNRAVLRQYLFEDYSINLETKKISKGSADRPNMFVVLVLEPIWELYELAVLSLDLTKLVAVAAERWKISLSPREINARDPRSTLQCIMRKWLPLADSLLRMVVKNMPSPREAQAKRAETLLNADAHAMLQSDLQMKEWFQSVECCNISADAPLVVFVSKMVSVKVSELSKEDVAMLSKQRAEKAQRQDWGEDFALELKPDQEVFLGVGRVFSGVLTRTSELHVIGHSYSPYGTDSSQCVRIEGNEKIGCYIMLGPSVFPVQSVCAGNIVGIVGLEDYVLKTATLSSTPRAFPLKPITFQAKPMLKVAVEPLSHRDLKSLEHALQCLYQFDPVVEVQLEDNGQWTMTCLGELHLDQCVKALTEKFMKSEVKVSEPLISFRETILPNAAAVSAADRQLPPPWCDVSHLDKSVGGRIRFLPDPNNPNLALTIRCFPLPSKAMDILEANASDINRLDEFLTDFYIHNQSFQPATWRGFLEQHKSVDEVWKAFLSKIRSELKEVTSSQNAVAIQQLTESISLLGGEDGLDSLLDNVLAIGPRKYPTNLLLFNAASVFEIYSHTVPTDESSLGCAGKLTRADYALSSKLWYRLHSAVVAGFQEAAKSGPLMAEPLYSIAFLVEKVEISMSITDQIFSPAERALVCGKEVDDDAQSASSQHTTATDRTDKLTTLSSGQMISEVKDALALVLLSSPLRMVEAIYQCDLQCDQSQLGNLYAVLSRRRGTVFKEDIIEGTSLFLLSAYLPVVQSFQFAQELLKRTSGSGTAPQLSFSHWATVGQDPFWRPRTDEELEEFGEAFLDEHNLARSWINKVRKRKGLAVDEQVVVFAEKQRTLNKKK